jgi:hypothetical protein
MRFVIWLGLQFILKSLRTNSCRKKDEKDLKEKNEVEIQREKESKVRERHIPSILIYKQLFSFSHILRSPNFMWKIIYMDKNNLTANQVKHIGIEKLTNQVCTITFAHYVVLFPMFQCVDV